MAAETHPWDYLIVTASNATQAAAYAAQLQLRRKVMGFSSDVREILVVPDVDGVRIGSGGSIIHCLISILNRERACGRLPGMAPADWAAALQTLRVLIVQAGGDSRRLPAYSPCGKIFVPLPGEHDSAVGLALFDRQMPTYLALPPNGADRGQVVITAGDVLLDFDPGLVRFDHSGLTGLGCYAAPEQAARHGVFCPGQRQRVRRFLQKPSPEQQRVLGAVDRYDRAALDIGTMSFDAETAVALLRWTGAHADASGVLHWGDAQGRLIMRHGLDFYCEICCALGEETDFGVYEQAARAGGSTWDAAALRGLFGALSAIPFQMQVLPHCSFLHFGALRQLIGSGMELIRNEQRGAGSPQSLDINTHISKQGHIAGGPGWVEGCAIQAELRLGGDNVVIGVDVDAPLHLPENACLDCIAGISRAGAPVHFVRCYAIDDDFKGRAAEGAARICGVPLDVFLRCSGAAAEQVWDAALPEASRSVWNARIFPAVSGPQDYRQWLWMLQPAVAAPEAWAVWRAADRYSLQEIAEAAAQDAFHARRARLHAAGMRESLPRLLRPESGLSAAEWAWAAENAGDVSGWIAAALHEAHRSYAENPAEVDLESLNAGRILHSLGSALLRMVDDNPAVADALPRALHALDAAGREWVASIGLAADAAVDLGVWARHAQAQAFAYLNRTIASSGAPLPALPRSALRKDEIVWGRAPARLDLGGGWSDTPPYALERGGCVINAAVDLNGQAPIQAYARVIDEPVIRLASIDFGDRVEIRELAELLDYRQAGGRFSLQKAALAISGFSPEAAPWPANASLRDMLKAFGGGIELTTLAAIPGGSGLGTSSIVAAVVLAAAQRVMGRSMTPRELFHGVLRLEQAMTTGGGWQDQVGGVIGGVKIITTQPALVPDPLIHFVPPHVLTHAADGGCMLLYYTGITRLAKNILQQVVGRYLDRDRAAMSTLARIHAFPARVADAMARNDLPAFGRALDAAWELKKRIDPGSTNEAIESLLAQARPYVHGAKLMGAGGGGFVLFACKSPEDAGALRRLLEKNPPNERARFFDFGVNEEGLVVTVC